MLGKPFVYLSESIITPDKTVHILKEATIKLGASARLDLSALWRQSALSLRSQSLLYSMPGFKGEKYHKWVDSVLDRVADGVSFPSSASAAEFKRQVGAQLGKPENYFVANSVRSFLRQLDLQGIGWGIIANESHLYLAVLKALGVEPTGPIVSATGPTMFKPLPKMWLRAYERAPAASKHDIWFIGSSNHPCDNMGANDLMRCVLVNPSLDKSDGIAQHFRVKQLEDLAPYLIQHQQPPPNLSFLDENDDDTDVAVTRFVPSNDKASSAYREPAEKLPLQGQEQGAVDYLTKK